MKIVVLILAVLLAAVIAAGQTTRKHSAVKARVSTKNTKQRRNILPRVGTIEDYSATGNTVGCGNYYLNFPDDFGVQEIKYVFLARSDGSNAWMNLNGRDIRLRQIETGRRQKNKRSVFNYRWRKVFISAVFKDFKPRNETEKAKADDILFETIITLRAGRVAKRLRAVGYSDC